MANIIIADDDRVMQKILKQLLEPEHCVRIANDGAEAQRLVDLERPDMVLLDLHMPIISGRVLAERLKHMGVSFLFISAEAEWSVIKDVIALGALAYLLKPFKLQQCLVTIESALQHVSERSEHEAGVMLKTAQGLLMERLRISEDASYKLIRNTARRENTTVDAVASDLIEHVERVNRFNPS